MTVLVVVTDTPEGSRALIAGKEELNASGPHSAVAVLSTACLIAPSNA
ncbi:hypothetical protein [Rhodococcus sp. T7]|nr:hypothetical protein [Rhodococcus sp. T7]KAF0965770.1 hypothetical protein MLGJGCBP_00962 [Rhodococcus sp. T7]